MNENDKEFYSNVAKNLVLGTDEHNYAGLAGWISAIASDTFSTPAKRLTEINYLLNAFDAEAQSDIRRRKNDAGE